MSQPLVTNSDRRRDQAVRVALVEDIHDVRQSWSRLLNQCRGLECACACASGEDALREIPPCQPDVVLMDIYLPRMSGIECTARMKVLLPKTQILILTVAEEHDMVFRALEAGADGYLLKRIKPAELRAAILDALSGGAPMSSEIARRVVESFRQKSRARDTTVHLTAREEEVLVLLSRGYSNKEIADQIAVGIETVRTHLKKIYEKMHVRSRTEAVAFFFGGQDLATGP
jgi:DNA-binding NarL/FixJ family response regulator